MRRGGRTDPPGFGRLWATAAAANLGDGVAVVLLPLLALRLDATPGQVAAVTAAGTAAWPLLGVLAGAVADAVDRTRLLLLVNLVRAALLLLLGWSFASGGDLVLVLVVAFLLGAGETLADTATTALVPVLVPPDRRAAANARLEATVNVLNQLLGPPVAGALMAVGAARAAVVTGCTYLAASLPVLRARRAGGVATALSGRQVLAGFSLLRRSRILARLTVFTAMMNLVWAGWMALFVVYAVAPGPLGLSEPEFGVLLSAMAVGGLLSVPFVVPITRRLGVARVLLLDAVGTVLLVAPAAAGLGWQPVALGAVAAGTGSTVWRTIAATIRHNTVPEHLSGRVYAASRVVSWGVLPVGAAAAGLAAEAVGVRATFAALSGLALVLVVAFPPAVRRLDLEGAFWGDPARAAADAGHDAATA